MTTENQAVETVKELFGAHPEDLISPIKSASDALIWLEEIFSTIQKEALNERNGYRIRNLAQAGAYLASDMGNHVGCLHENYFERLKVAGVVPPGVKPA